MALEAVVFPQDLFGYSCKEWYAMGGGAWGSDFMGFGEVLEEEEKKGKKVLEFELVSKVGGSWDHPSSSSLVPNLEEWDANSSLLEACEGRRAWEGEAREKEATGRRKRRRAKSVKNKEEVESQRMIHIAVERNRRKQMNEYLAVLRALMPPSYVQRGDQASIIGGAINYVKELEQLLQSLEVQKRLKQGSDETELTHPFADFFTFPQYSSCSSNTNSSSSSSSNIANETAAAENRSAMADYKQHMPSPLSEIKFVDTRKPIDKPGVGRRSGRRRGGDGVDCGGGATKSGGSVPGGQGERGSGLAAFPGSREDASPDGAPGLGSDALKAEAFRFLLAS